MYFLSLLQRPRRENVIFALRGILEGLVLLGPYYCLRRVGDGSGLVIFWRGSVSENSDTSGNATTI